MKAKTIVSKKVTGKEKITAPKPVVVKAPKQKKEKNVIIKEAKVELTSFTVRMTIPIQQYGNVQPELTVTGPSIERVIEEVMPIMEKLYQTYAETSREGKVPAFFNKANVEVTERKVDPAKVEAPKEQTAPAGSQTTAPAAPQATAKAENTAEGKKDESPTGPAVKSEGYLKAEKAIATSTSTEALDKVGEAIEKSVKIDQADKHFLITAVLKKHKELASK